MKGSCEVTYRISKTLSANDLGSTGAHQAGILVPKNPEILKFFPSFQVGVKNPRHFLVFTDEQGDRWEFCFIYYNGKFFGGTRNEYRLTRMTTYFRQAGLAAGDELVLKSPPEGGLQIRFKRARTIERGNGVLRLGAGWKVVALQGE